MTESKHPELFGLEIGDAAVFDNGVTRPETIEIEDFRTEPAGGEKVWVAIYQGTAYQVRFLTKKEENQNAE